MRNNIGLAEKSAFAPQADPYPYDMGEGSLHKTILRWIKLNSIFLGMSYFLRFLDPENPANDMDHVFFNRDVVKDVSYCQGDRKKWCSFLSLQNCSFLVLI